MRLGRRIPAESRLDPRTCLERGRAIDSRRFWVGQASLLGDMRRYSTEDPSEDFGVKGQALMAFRDFGEFKSYAAQRFVGILRMVVKDSLKTQSAIPPWAAAKVKESWNV
jgi:hypothetical protein